MMGQVWMKGLRVWGMSIPSLYGGCLQVPVSDPDEHLALWSTTPHGTHTAARPSKPGKVRIPKHCFFVSDIRILVVFLVFRIP